MDQRLNFAMELDKYRNQIKKKETECREMIKASENEQQRHRIELENRARLDNELKKYSQQVIHIDRSRLLSDTKKERSVYGKTKRSSKCFERSQKGKSCSRISKEITT